MIKCPFTLVVVNICRVFGPLERKLIKTKTEEERGTIEIKHKG